MCFCTKLIQKSISLISCHLSLTYMIVTYVSHLYGLKCKCTDSFTISTKWLLIFGLKVRPWIRMCSCNHSNKYYSAVLKLMTWLFEFKCMYMYIRINLFLPQNVGVRCICLQLSLVTYSNLFEPGCEEICDGYTLCGRTQENYFSIYGPENHLCTKPRGNNNITLCV